MSVAGVAASAVRVSADTQTSNFEALSTGTVNGQDGWTSLGAAGSGCATYDHAVALNSALPSGAPASFGTKSLRISDAVTSGCFSDQTFSKKVVDEAGEPTADAGAFASGVRKNHFVASFDLASVVPGAQQPGLFMSVAPDRGDGARMSYVGISDGATGWDLNFVDYKDAAPFGDVAGLDAGCGPEDDFISTPIATGVSRSVAHTITFQMTLAAGPHNDLVKVLLDGSQIASGTSWEDYFRYCGESGGGTAGTLPDKSRTVRSLLFRTAAGDVPADLGKGFLVDNLSVASSNVLPDPPVETAVTSVTPGTATVSFTPGNDQGFPITSFTVTCVGTIGQPTVMVSGPSSPIVVTGLINNTPYVCTVTETNVLGTSGPSNNVAVVWPFVGAPHCTDTGVPSAPPGIPTSAEGNSSATVSWAVPLKGCIAGYVVTPYLGTTAQTPTFTFGAGTTTLVKGLVNGESYSFTVAAENGTVTGPASAHSTPITAGVPTPATSLKATRVAKGALKVSFKAGASNGAPITRFTAACKSSNGGVAKANNGKANPVTVTGLTAGKTYTCTVRETNSRGTGRASARSAPVKA